MKFSSFLSSLLIPLTFNVNVVERGQVNRARVNDNCKHISGEDMLHKAFDGLLASVEERVQKRRRRRRRRN